MRRNSQSLAPQADQEFRKGVGLVVLLWFVFGLHP